MRNRNLGSIIWVEVNRNKEVNAEGWTPTAADIVYEELLKLVFVLLGVEEAEAWTTSEHLEVTFLTVYPADRDFCVFAVVICCFSTKEAQTVLSLRLICET